MKRFVILIIGALIMNSALAASSIQNMQLLIDQNLYAPAAKAGETLLKENADQLNVLFLTAYSFQMDGQLKKASEMYQKIIRQHPDWIEPKNNLAIIYLEEGDLQSASQLLEEALDTNDAYAVARRNLALIYTGKASEAYRRAVSESATLEPYQHKIKLAAINNLSSLKHDNHLEETPNIVNEVKSPGLADLVKQWAHAWSNKDIETYAGFYSREFKPRFSSHDAWVEHRRKRIMRPGEINLVVSDIKIRSQDENIARIDFKQSYKSPRYSDKVKKRLVLRRIDSQWKIIDETVLSVL